jgi:predicted alpha/beta superfamily hydrolase
MYKNIFLVIFHTSQLLCYAQEKIEKIIIGNKVEFHSKVLDEDRKILIRLPEDYNKSKQKYPVLYMLDGELFFYRHPLQSNIYPNWDISVINQFCK